MRLSRDTSLPLHFEPVPLKIGWRVAGWALGAVALPLGVTLVGFSTGVVSDAVGPALVVVAGVALVALIRCHRVEVTVGTRLVEVRNGPLRRTVPVGAVEAASARPASGWRRLYADREVVLQVSVGSGEVSVPSRETAELLAVLKQPGGESGSPPGGETA